MREYEHGCRATGTGGGIDFTKRRYNVTALQLCQAFTLSSFGMPERHRIC